MAMTMPAEELELLIAGYVLGNLSSEEAAQFEQLLATNPAIAGEVAQLQSALETTYAPPPMSPPPALRSRLLAAASEVSSPPTPVFSPPSQPFWRSPRSLLELAAAAVIVALGVNNYRLSQALQVSQAETQQAVALTYQLRSTQANSLASAQVKIDPQTLKGTIAVQNLPPLPPGKVYVLWTVLQPAAPFTTDQKDAILTQAFQVNDRGTTEQAIIVPAAFRDRALVTKVAITVEDAIAPQKHVGKPIMVAPASPL